MYTCLGAHYTCCKGTLPCCLVQMIDEFSDISKGEKEVMKMWNIHALNER